LTDILGVAMLNYVIFMLKSMFFEKLFVILQRQNKTIGI